MLKSLSVLEMKTHTDDQRSFRKHDLMLVKNIARGNRNPYHLVRMSIPFWLGNSRIIDAKRLETRQIAVDRLIKTKRKRCRTAEMTPIGDRKPIHDIISNNCKQDNQFACQHRQMRNF